MSKELKLTDREWKEVVFGEVFDIRATRTGLDKKRLLGEEGEIPYITRTDNNNGIDGFIAPQYGIREDEGNVITIGLDTQTVFYQGVSFYTGQNIQVVRHEQLNRHNALFIIRAIKLLVQKFSWGSYGATLTRLRRGKLYLPISVDGIPDWEFMSAYIQQEEERLIASARKKLEKQLLGNIVSLGTLNDREWKDFCFSDIFEIVDGYYNKKPPVSEGGILPFLGATQAQNGLTGFTSVELVMMYDKVGEIAVSDKEKRVYRGGCIAITNDGSVGHAYYQAREFTCSHSITVVYLKGREMTKHLALFLIPSIQKVGQSFAYAKKWRPIRMRRSKLMLPIDANGMPDWEFMSAFMLRMEHETLSKALAFFRPK